MWRLDGWMDREMWREYDPARHGERSWWSESRREKSQETGREKLGVERQDLEGKQKSDCDRERRESSDQAATTGSGRSQGETARKLGCEGASLQ